MPRKQYFDQLVSPFSYWHRSQHNGVSYTDLDMLSICPACAQPLLLADHIYNKDNHVINCRFKFSSIENTSNKITFKFDNCHIDLYLYEDNSNLVIKTKDEKQFILNNYSMDNYPNYSISQGAKYWEVFLQSYKDKKISYSCSDDLLLTTQIIELYYAK